MPPNNQQQAQPAARILNIASDWQTLLQTIQADVPLHVLLSSHDLYLNLAACSQLYASLKHLPLRTITIMGPHAHANWVEDCVDAAWELEHLGEDIENMPLQEVLISVSLAYEDEDFEFAASDMFLHSHLYAEQTETMSAAQYLAWFHPQIAYETQAMHALIAAAKQQGVQTGLISGL